MSFDACSPFNEDMALWCCGKVCFVVANEVFQPFYLLIPLRTTELWTVLFPGSYIIEENHGVTFSILSCLPVFFFFPLLANNTVFSGSAFPPHIPVWVLKWMLDWLPLLPWIESKGKASTSCTWEVHVYWLPVICINHRITNHHLLLE